MKRLTYTLGTGTISRREFLKKVNEMDFPTVHSQKSIEYYNIPAAFDIETTSFYVDNIKEPENKRAILYHWQFGIWNLVTTGRTWDELLQFLSTLSIVLDLSPEKRLAIYVHNLPYEFQWLRKRIDWEKIFILDSRKPVYAISGGLEFRDMLKLAGGRALDTVAKDLQKYKVEKMVGDLDYNLIRTPETPMTEKELKYCENDVRVCLAYIMEKIEQDGDITKIPLTNTGYVRQYCRKKCYKRWKKYRSIMNELTISPDEYRQLKQGFQGGFTHANAHYVRKVLHNVGSFDLTSAYPAVMMLEKFPMSHSILVDQKMSREQLEDLLMNYCCLFDLELFDVVPKLFQDHPISVSKCTHIEGEVVDNGRVAFADNLVTTVTEQDYFTYREFYDWSREEIRNLRVYHKSYLPQAFVEAILGLYKSKTTLKGVEGQELEYMISKNMLNAAYGMSVTNPVRIEYDYVDDIFTEHDADVDSSIHRYNTDVKRFLFYPWGVWVTSYCRANLFSAIRACGDDYVYADTDSVKILHPEKHTDYFEAYNNEILNKIQRAAKVRGHDPSEYSPVNQKGVKCTIGFWDDEGVYDEFKTLGAKRYLVNQNGHYKLTVAGTNKKRSCDYLVATGKPFELFDDSLCIPSDATGKNLLTYIDDRTAGYVTDYLGNEYMYDELTSIHMENAEYNLSLSESFIRYLKGVRDYGE